MKKGAKIMLSLAGIILLAGILSQLAHAQEPASGASLAESYGQVQNIAEKIPQTPEEAAAASKNYLKQEWGKMLANNTYTRPVIKAYGKISPYTDPVFKYCLGMTPELSWLFFLTLIIWITLGTFVYQILSVFSLVSKGLSLGISFLASTALGYFEAQRILAEKIISLISLAGAWWMQVILVLAVILALSLASGFSKAWAEGVKRLKKKIEEERRERKAQMVEKLNDLELKAKGIK